MIFEMNNFYFKFNLLFILSLYFLFFNNHNENLNNTTNIPELLYYENQRLQLFIPSKNCLSTLFFSIENKTYNTSNNIKTINLREKNYFSTFYKCDFIFDDYYQILMNNGLIKSSYKYGKNNFFLCPMDNVYLY